MNESDKLEKGLIVNEEPINKILEGKKTWEMRNSHIKIRGPLALIKKGSKAIFGVVDVIDSIGPISDQDMLDNIGKHQIPSERLFNDEVKNRRFAWVFSDVRKLSSPVPYDHKNGQQKFVILSKSEIAEINKRLNILSS